METKEPPEPPPRNPMRIMTSVSTTEVNYNTISVTTNLIKIQFPPSQKIVTKNHSNHPRYTTSNDGQWTCREQGALKEHRRK